MASEAIMKTGFEQYIAELNESAEIEAFWQRQQRLMNDRKPRQPAIYGYDADQLSYILVQHSED